MATILEGILLWLFTARLALGFVAHVDTEDLLGVDECIEPGNSCAQYAMQLRGLKRQTEIVEDDCKDLPDLGEGTVQWFVLVLLGFKFLRENFRLEREDALSSAH